MNKNKLTAKQKRFVEEYPIDFNATQAAIRAGYSRHTAHAIGQENLRKPIIKAALSELKDKMSKKTGITRETLVKLSMETYNNATAADQHSAANQALANVARMLGLNEPEKLEHSGFSNLIDALAGLHGEGSSKNTSKAS